GETCPTYETSFAPSLERQFFDALIHIPRVALLVLMKIKVASDSNFSPANAKCLCIIAAIPAWVLLPVCGPGVGQLFELC
ncbi:MAG: hypothetical protein WCD56_02120, partial [Pseudolabrys sp.]